MSGQSLWVFFSCGNSYCSGKRFRNQAAAACDSARNRYEWLFLASDFHIYLRFERNEEII